MTRGIAYGSNPDTCPVRALQAWLEITYIKDGPLFRSLRFGRVQPRGLDGRDARIVKRAAALAGLNPPHFNRHSLRAGLATAAAAAGVSERAIMDRELSPFHSSLNCSPRTLPAPASALY